MKKLDEISKKNIFEVPTEYFEQLPYRIVTRIEGELKTGMTVGKVLSTIPKKNIYPVPQQYFEQLPLAIQNKIEGISIDTREVLTNLPRKSVFATPDRYFDQLALKIQNRIENERKHNYLPLWNWKPALKYALPLITLGIALMLYLRPNPATDWQAQLKEVESEHLVAYLSDSELTITELIESAHFNVQELDLLNLQMHSGLIHDDVNEKELQSELENEL
ncbi:MAG: hypothetical protein OJF59_002873 [Cytophagales bacterium]|jgi:hypothetical protein|nr:hypothetical protein [Bacteroidota bacterium]MBS1981740.1 hypothetical protein [Bacteroidota bacterium]WHZ09117.1 MAG: hypothetical protein OJF59_002873 [Cytophagales bacterium]